MNYTVEKIDPKIAKEYIHKNHYSHGSHRSPSPCYGLFDGDCLIGVCMFATPCSENVRASLWGKDNVNHVTELHRLHILDVTPCNTESWFISRVFQSLRKDRPEIWGVISFSDPTEGHEGTIYKATNAYRIGKTSKTSFYLDQTGRLRHPRQCGVNITVDMAKDKGWKKVSRCSKNRYMWIFPHSKSHKKWLVDNCKYDIKTQKFH